MAANGLTSRPRFGLIALVAVVAGFPARVPAQELRIRPVFSLGLVSQSGPLAGRSGPMVAIGVPVTFLRYFFLTPTIDYASLNRGSDNAICIPADGDPATCLGGGNENFLDFALTAGFAVPAKKLRPYVEGGAVYMNSLAEEIPGERNAFFTFQLQGGLQVRSPIGRWSLSLRWRRIDRWRPRDATGEYALILGYRPGKGF